MVDLLSDVPVRRSTTPGEILTDLACTGLALIDTVPDRSSLLMLARRLGAVVVPHRDSGPDGVTVIEDRGAGAAELAGFTRGPPLLITVCGRDPISGGEFVLVDGYAVYLDLAEYEPAALAAFSAPRSARFGGAGGHWTSVFRVAGGVVSVRFRLDSLAEFGLLAEPYVPTLRAAIERHSWTVPAHRSTGYVVDNRRWLHGRRAYTGPRVVYRITAGACRADMIVGGVPERVVRRTAS